MCKFIIMCGDAIISEIEGDMADFNPNGEPKLTKHPLPGYSDPDAFLEVALKADVVNEPNRDSFLNTPRSTGKEEPNDKLARLK